MITKTPTKEMSREQWLEERRKGIGGSDAAAVLGLNSYTSPYALFCEKTGKIVPEDISDKEAVRLGTDLEDYVAKRFEEATEKKVRRNNFILRNDDYPFAHANVDRLIVGEDAGLECKTTSSYEIIQQLKNGEIPPHWYCQMVHYMMVTGAKKWYLGALAFGRGFYHFELERNEAVIEALANAEREFWAKVNNGIAPATDGTESTKEALKTVFRESIAMSVDMTPVAAHVEVYNQLGKQIKDMTEQQEAAANLIKAYMGQAEKGTWGNTTITWKTSARKTFDKDLYEKEHGTIDARYYKESMTRTFRVSVKKGE